jgi:hypothetical protein
VCHQPWKRISTLQQLIFKKESEGLYYKVFEDTNLGINIFL